MIPGSMRSAASITSGTNNESEGERGRVEVSGDHPIARSMRPSPECLADIAEMEAQNAANVRALLRGEHASAPPAQPQEEWPAEAEIGRWVYRRIEALMDAMPGTPEAAELTYLAAVAERVEEGGEENGGGAELAPFVFRASLSDEQIKHMVGRFLGWRLPETFSPDAGITFKAEFNEHTQWPMRHEPIGTNLFDYDEAEAMVRHMLEGMPARRPANPAEGAQDG